MPETPMSELNSQNQSNYLSNLRHGQRGDGHQVSEQQTDKNCDWREAYLGLGGFFIVCATIGLVGDNLSGPIFWSKLSLLS